MSKLLASSHQSVVNQVERTAHEINSALLFRAEAIIEGKDKAFHRLLAFAKILTTDQCQRLFLKSKHNYLTMMGLASQPHVSPSVLAEISLLEFEDDASRILLEVVALNPRSSDETQVVVTLRLAHV